MIRELPQVLGATTRDPLLGFVFLLDDGPWRGEVARVVRVMRAVNDVLVCVLDTTAGPHSLPRADVAVVYHRMLGTYYPDPPGAPNARE